MVYWVTWRQPLVFSGGLEVLPWAISRWPGANRWIRWNWAGVLEYRLIVVYVPLNDVAADRGPPRDLCDGSWDSTSVVMAATAENQIMAATAVDLGDEGGDEGASENDDDWEKVAASTTSTPLPPGPLQKQDAAASRSKSSDGTDAMDSQRAATVGVRAAAPKKKHGPAWTRSRR